MHKKLIFFNCSPATEANKPVGYYRNINTNAGGMAPRKVATGPLNRKPGLKTTQAPAPAWHRLLLQSRLCWHPLHSQYNHSHLYHR
jgi:hypothetical protein